MHRLLLHRRLECRLRLRRGCGRAVLWLLLGDGVCISLASHQSIEQSIAARSRRTAQCATKIELRQSSAIAIQGMTAERDGRASSD